MEGGGGVGNLRRNSKQEDSIRFARLGFRSPSSTATKNQSVSRKSGVSLDRII